MNKIDKKSLYYLTKPNTDPTTLSTRNINSNNEGIDLVKILSCEGPGEEILKYLSERDIVSFRLVCPEFCLLSFQKGFFNLSITPDKLQTIKPAAHLRLYPKFENSTEFKPIPADAVVKNATDLQTILADLADNRFFVKNVVFKGYLKDLPEVCKVLCETISTQNHRVIKIAGNVKINRFTNDIAFTFPTEVRILPDPFAGNSNLSDPILKKGIPDDFEFIGSLLQKANRFEEALEFYYKALDIYKYLSSDKELVCAFNAYVKISEILKAQGNPGEAKKYSDMAAHIDEVLNSRKKLINNDVKGILRNV